MKVQANLKSGITSVQEGLKKPHVQKALKITAVALATLVLVAAMIAVTVLVSTPVFFSVFPIIGVGTAVACFIARKKSKDSSANEMQKVVRAGYERPVEMQYAFPFGYESPVERINRDVYGMPSSRFAHLFRM